MRAAVSGFVVRSLLIGRVASSRDFADVLPSTSAGPVLVCATAIVAIIGILDLLHYWPG